MPSTYSDLLRFINQENGENSTTWGDLVDVNFELIEDAIAGTEIVSVTTASDITLSSNNGASDESRKAVLKLTGTLGASINIIVPSSSKLYVVEASGVTWGSYTITVKTSGGSGVQFDSDSTKGFVYCDGTDVIGILDTNDFLLKVNNLSDLASIATAKTNLGLGALADEDTVSTSLIDDDAVTSAKIADGTIVAANIADAAVTSAKMSATGITAGDYELVSLTVDAAGRITAVQSGSSDGAAPGTGTVGQAQLKTSTSTTTVEYSGRDALTGYVRDGNKYETILGQPVLRGEAWGSAGYGWNKRVTLTGGEYGFEPELKLNIDSSYPYNVHAYALPCSNIDVNSVENGYGGYLVEVRPYDDLANPERVTFTVRQRYVTASAPYNLGDGDVFGFMFLLLGENDELQGMSLADTPPWVYNGPTSIKPDLIDFSTGQKYKYVPKNMTKEAILAGEEPEMEIVEIDHEMKNADMKLIPHPFGKIREDQKVVMVDPLDPDIGRLLKWQEAGMDIWEILKEGKLFKVDTKNTVNRKTPDGVLPVSLVKG